MKATPSPLTGSLLILITAALWGFTFVAQKTGMNYFGPFMFSALRFLIGASCLVIMLRWLGKSKLTKQGVMMAVIMGVVLTFGIMLQQIGLTETTAGKGGFITAIYILMVPILLSFGGRRLPLQVWPAAFLTLWGLYLLSINEGDVSSINNGDYWVLASAIFWAIHIILIEKAVRHHDPLRLSIVQFYVCGFLSLAGAFIFEDVVWNNVWTGLQAGYIEIAYASVASVAIAFTLQVFAQRSVPSHIAALIMSLEAVFAVLGGIWLLGEELTVRMLWGLVLMFVGVVLAQWRFKSKDKETIKP